MHTATQYDDIIVGAGLCGLYLAAELSKRKRRVLVLEKGRAIRRMGSVVRAATFYDKMAVLKSREGVILYRVLGVGGTSLVSCGNAVKVPPEYLAAVGIDAPHDGDPVAITDGARRLGAVTSKLTESANRLGFETRPMPKFKTKGPCTACGKCVLGCPTGVKWTALEFLESADPDYLALMPRFSVERVIARNGKAEGVVGRSGSGRRQFEAGRIVLCAGGIGTPVILQQTGIRAGEQLFADLFTITYGRMPTGMHHQVDETPMAAVCDAFFQKDGFILSPFIDNYWSFLTNAPVGHLWNACSLGALAGIMTKIRDDHVGRVFKNGAISKSPTQADREKLNKGSQIAGEILRASGADPKSLFVTRPCGAHPGGTAAVGRVVDVNYRTEMENLFVCDASVFPYAPGVPPMATLLLLVQSFLRKNEE